MRKFILIALLFSGVAQAATYLDQGENKDGITIFFFQDATGPIACIQPLEKDGPDAPILCWRPGDVKYVCKQELAHLGQDMVWRGFISNCKREEW